MGVFAIVNNRFEVTYIGAGDFIDAHLVSIRAYEQVYLFDASLFAGAPADIVITGSSAPTNHLFFPYRLGSGQLRSYLQRRGHNYSDNPVPRLRRLARLRPDGPDAGIYAPFSQKQGQGPQGLLRKGPGTLGRLHLVEDLRSDDPQECRR